MTHKTQCETLEQLESRVHLADGSSVELIVACIAAAVRAFPISARCERDIRFIFRRHLTVSDASNDIATYARNTPIGQVTIQLSRHLRDSELAREMVLYLLNDSGLRLFGIFCIRDAVNRYYDIDALHLLDKAARADEWKGIRDRIQKRVVNSVF